MLGDIVVGGDVIVVEEAAMTGSDASNPRTQACCTVKPFKSLRMSARDPALSIRCLTHIRIRGSIREYCCICRFIMAMRCASVLEWYLPKSQGNHCYARHNLKYIAEYYAEARNQNAVNIVRG